MKLNFISAAEKETIIFDFHVSNSSRNKYKIEDSLFSIRGKLIIVNFHLARILAGRINEKRKSEGNTHQMTTAGQLNTVGLMHEIFHYLIRIYEDDENPGVFSRGINFLTKNLGEDNLKNILLTFTKEFSPIPVYQRKISAEEYLEQFTGAKSNKEIILEELILLYLENSNPAASALEELYSSKPLKDKTDFQNFIVKLEYFFMQEKPFGKENLSLISFLKKPLLESPYSLEGQLEFIRDNWGIYIKDKFLDRLLSGKDLMMEDLRLFIQQGGFEKPTPPVPVYDFNKDYFNELKERLSAGETLSDIEKQYYNSEIEKFTQDIDWMPKVVMIAKNSYVWLDQLSKKYKRQITRLDQIPDEELDTLARWNFTALWLIGIWERSSASRKIKQLTGNPDAAPSAYSLFDYIIAHDLGGEEAFQNLKYRAAQRGIKLASDMVPNHTGIYSKWMIEKPDYFIQTDSPPYPNYSFYSPNLSDDSRVEVRIEDKYYSREDAAVVFQRRDTRTGAVKYIYHGNDGTHMPWNDTAQLNLLNPEVKESLIQTILHVARKFPIIRFDAAMTLAKKHYQRLWFPQPGTGGAIPSRSDYAMTRQAFDDAMPEEFWREVVDRINSEMPSTLLLAEAFWLMEGYFVRTLGMHRVYNSAFMHMLMKEENDKYRELIKNTLDFNPEILKRYVNFMSNPDEETAVNQFGKGDKYFGVSILMVTLPGLPMFAHGQIEGFAEKYGMEYKRAYYDESVDENLVRRHEAEIFPLIKKRYLFSQVINFEFYDFINDTGGINENVFAYSNTEAGERALVVYNNSYSQAAGRINYSVIKNIDGNAHSNNKRIVRIFEALQIKSAQSYFYSCKDQRTGLEYLLCGKDVSESGLYFSLNGYEYKALINFNEIFDVNGDYAKLYQLINGEGVASVSQKLEEMKLSPLHEALNDLFSKDTFDEFTSACFKGNDDITIPNFLKDKIYKAENEIRELKKIEVNGEESIERIKLHLTNLRTAFSFLESYGKHLTKNEFPLRDLIFSVKDTAEKDTLYTYIILNCCLSSMNTGQHIGKFFEELLLPKLLVEIFKEAGHNVEKIFEEASLIKALLSKKDIINSKNIFAAGKESIFISELINNHEISSYIQLNEFDRVIYFNKERFENLIDWIFILFFISGISSLQKTDDKAPSKQKKIKTKKGSSHSSPQLEFKESLAAIKTIKAKSEESGYRLLTFKELLSEKKLKTKKENNKKVTKKKPAKRR